MSVRRRAAGLAVSWGVASSCALAGMPGAAGAAAADGCPNAGIRAQQGMGQTAECRAFELVSPAEKDGGDVRLNGTVQSARQPGAVVFETPNTLPGAETSVAEGFYASRRTVDGWEMRPLDPPQLNAREFVLQVTRWVSPDVSVAIEASRRALAPGATEGASNVYLHDLLSGTRRVFAASPARVGTFPSLFNSFIAATDVPVLGASSDLRHVVFATKEALLPDAPSTTLDGFGTNVYEWFDGQLRLVGRYPDGSTMSSGTLAGGASAVSHGTTVPYVISADGSRIVFKDARNSLTGGIYLRENGTTTKLVSHSQRTGDDPTVSHDAVLAGMSADGGTVYFVSGHPLVDDLDPGSGSSWIYRYDTSSGVVTMVTPLGGGGSDVWQVSDDGERVYFSSSLALAPGAEDGGAQLYLWDHGTVKLVARGTTPSPFSMSDDGRYAAFLSFDDPLGENASSPDCHANANAGIPEGRCQGVYGYDAVSGELACLSCPREGRAAGHASIGPSGGVLGRSHPVTVLEDGTVFFDTPTALVSDDTNGRRDVYEARIGDPARRLVTSGSKDADAGLRDVSADGTDVYFVTDARLVGVDRDDITDLYSARRDGGLAAQNPAARVGGECGGESCRAAATPQPASREPASLAVRGAGNVAAVRRAPAARLVVSGRRSGVGARLRLRVRLSGGGAVVVAGPSVRTVRRGVARAGTAVVGVTLTPRAARSLRTRTTLRTAVTVRFAPKGGHAVSKRLVLTFKQAKGGR